MEHFHRSHGNADPRAITPTNDMPPPPPSAATAAAPTIAAAAAIGQSPSSGGQVKPQEVHAKHDLLVWFEVLELGMIPLPFTGNEININVFSRFPSASSGEYVPVLVDHGDELPCRGQFYLHHGLQRRIRITLVHDTTGDLRWKDVRELVVGRIRSTPESDLDDDLDGSVLSLGLFPGEYLDSGGQVVTGPPKGSLSSQGQTPASGSEASSSMDSGASAGTGYERKQNMPI